MLENIAKKIDNFVKVKSISNESKDICYKKNTRSF